MLNKNNIVCYNCKIYKSLGQEMATGADDYRPILLASTLNEGDTLLAPFLMTTLKEVSGGVAIHLNIEE